MTEDHDKPKLDIDWVKTFAGALAAVSSAVLLSTLGAAGTLIGAALGSVVLTVSSALYSQGLARSKAKLAAAQEVAQQKVGLAKADVRRAGRRTNQAEVDSHLKHAEEQLGEAKAELEGAGAEAEQTWQERLKALPWKRIALAAAGFFLIAMLVITAFELITGRAVSSLTGGTDGRSGTSISRVTGNHSDDKEKDKKREKKDDDRPTTGDDPTSGPTSDPRESSEEPTTSEPSSDPSSEPSSEPSEEPSSEPTTPTEPTVSPSPTKLQESPGAAEQAPVE